MESQRHLSDQETVAVLLFENSAIDAQLRFQKAIELGISKSGDGLKVNLVDRGDIDEFKEVYFSDFVDEQSTEESNFHLFSIHNHGRPLGKLALATLVELDWSVVSFIVDDTEYFSLARSAFEEDCEKFGVHPYGSMKAKLGEPIDFANSMFEIPRIQAIFGEMTFVRSVLCQRGRHILGDDKTDSLSFSGGFLIVTHNCQALTSDETSVNDRFDLGLDEALYDQNPSEFDEQCISIIPRMLTSTICVDQSNIASENWIDTVWLTHDNSVKADFVDYRIVSMYDNGVWLGEAMTEQMKQDNPQSLSSIISELNFSGFSTSNIPDQTPELSIKTLRFGRFQRLYSSISGTIPDPEAFSRAVASGTGGLPSDHSIYDMSWTGAGITMLIIILISLLGTWVNGIHKRFSDFRFGILAKSDGIMLLLITCFAFLFYGLHYIGFSICGHCFDFFVILPSIRFAIIALVLFCNYEFYRIVANRTWKILPRLSSFGKFLFIIISFVISVGLITIIDALGAYSYDSLLFARPSNPTEMLEICEVSSYWKNSTFRWWGSIIKILSSIFLASLIVIQLQLTSIGYDMKGLKKRREYLKMGVFIISAFLVVYGVSLIYDIGMGSCQDLEKMECPALGDGFDIYYGSLLLDFLFYGSLVIYPVLQEVLYTLKEEGYISVRKRKGIKTFFREKGKVLRRSSFDQRLAIQDRICPLNPYAAISLQFVVSRSSVMTPPGTVGNGAPSRNGSIVIVGDVEQQKQSKLQREMQQQEDLRKLHEAEEEYDRKHQIRKRKNSDYDYNNNDSGNNNNNAIDEKKGNDKEIDSDIVGEFEDDHLNDDTIDSVVNLSNPDTYRNQQQYRRLEQRVQKGSTSYQQHRERHGMESLKAETSGNESDGSVSASNNNDKTNNNSNNKNPDSSTTWLDGDILTDATNEDENEERSSRQYSTSRSRRSTESGNHSGEVKKKKIVDIKKHIGEMTSNVNERRSTENVIESSNDSVDDNENSVVFNSDSNSSNSCNDESPNNDDTMKKKNITTKRINLNNTDGDDEGSSSSHKKVARHSILSRVTDANDANVVDGEEVDEDSRDIEDSSSITNSGAFTIPSIIHEMTNFSSRTPKYVPRDDNDLYEHNNNDGESLGNSFVEANENEENGKEVPMLQRWWSSSSNGSGMSNQSRFLTPEDELKTFEKEILSITRTERVIILKKLAMKIKELAHSFSNKECQVRNIMTHLENLLEKNDVLVIRLRRSMGSKSWTINPAE